MIVARHWTIGCVIACSVSLVSPVTAVEMSPTHAQIQAALDRGKNAAVRHQPPETWYTRFGGSRDLDPGGFLVTKIGALSVMATHMALRGMEPTAADVAQVIDARTMLVTAVIFGDAPSFATDSYIMLDQGGHTVKPVMVRVDGQVDRSAAWPKAPRFKAKIVASFNYSDVDPSAQTTITLYPGQGGTVSFSVDLAQIE